MTSPKFEAQIENLFRHQWPAVGADFDNILGSIGIRRPHHCQENLVDKIQTAGIDDFTEMYSMAAGFRWSYFSLEYHVSYNLRGFSRYTHHGDSTLSGRCGDGDDCIFAI